MTTLAYKAQRIRLLALDVDGVLTDGRLYYSAEGEQLKVFNTLDGHGLKMLQQCDIQVAIITGRNAPAMTRRMNDLGIKHIYAGREDKLTALKELWMATGITADETAYMGDDWPDIPALRECGLSATVPNADPAVIDLADWCATRKGGLGAVRELCELLLRSQNRYDSLLQSYLEDQG